MSTTVKGEVNSAYCHEDGQKFRIKLTDKNDAMAMSDRQAGTQQVTGQQNGSAVSGNDVIPEVVIETKPPIIYKIQDSPPWGLTCFFAFQQSLLSIAGSLIAPLLVAEAACALEDGVLVRKLVSSTMMMNGISTLLQNVLGIRLPVFQGPSGSYAVPIIALNKMDKTRCDTKHFYEEKYGSNSSANISDVTLEKELIDVRLREMMGPLILVGILHALVGATGLVGIMMKFVGPITIVPTILLIGLYLVKPVMSYAETHWGIAFMTWAIGVILSLYLGQYPMPIPVWTRKKGFRIIRYPLHQVFAILISILIGWAVCGVLTYADMFTNDKDSKGFKARTDARADTLAKSDWFYVPYPGQFGSPLFSLSCLVGFFMATVTSILDSIGDYYATAAMCRVPPPPKYAVNRGIAIEGFCSSLSGIMGCGHATTTYGGNIGGIGMTKVASRRVFITLSLMYIVFGMLAKVMAVFISIPYPVLGGTVITILGVFVGVNLSNLRVVDLSSTRNLSIIGMAIFIGVLVPSWIEENGEVIQTGYRRVDQVITMFAGNPNFIGCFLACFLDNTVPGTDKERGIAAWKSPETVEQDPNVQYLEGTEVYDMRLPKWLSRRRWVGYLPFCPNHRNDE